METPAELIREVGIGRLCNFDGCTCSHFSVRSVNVDISCRKGRDGPLVHAWSSSPDFHDNQEALQAVVEEVVDQLEEYTAETFQMRVGGKG